MARDLNLIGRVPSSHQIRRGYDLWSVCYDKVAAPWEHGPRLRGLDAAEIRPGEHVLDVGAGTGAVLLTMLDRFDPPVHLFGVDVSLRMLRKARRRLSAPGHTNAHLLAGDARALPFAGRNFDVLYSAYALDLLALEDVPVALAEFHRVLKPDGRLILVNMTKENGRKISWFERFYRAMPSSCAAYLLGGCRPVILDELVRQAHFRDVRREYIPNIIPSEIVAARKPLWG